MSYSNYELMVLVKNEVKNMQLECVGGESIKYLKEKAENILKYINEMNF